MLRKVRYDAFDGTPMDHLLRLWGIDTLVICGTVANIFVHYTAAGATLRWYDVVIPRDAISALDPFDLESSLRRSVRRPHHDCGRRAGLTSDERRVERRVEDRPLGRRRQRLREQRHGPVHLGS